MHGVDVGFAEEGSGKRDNGRDADLGGLSELALVTGVDIPFDVAVEGGPPEAIEDGSSSRVDAFMTEAVVDFTDDAQ